MAISVPHNSAATQAISAASATSSPTFTSTSGNLLIALCTGDGPGEAATPLDDGGTNSWTVLGKSANTGADPDYADIGYAKSITGKAGQSATYSLSTTGFPNVCLLEVSGCDTTSPNSVAASYTSEANSSAAINSTLITPTAGDHIIVVVGCDSSGAASQSFANAGTGTATWTTIKNDGVSGLAFAAAYTIVTADGSHTYGVQYTSGGSGVAGTGVVVGIAAFKAVAGGATLPPGLGPVEQMDMYTMSAVAAMMR